MDPDGYLCLPYVDETLSSKVNSIARKCGLNVRVAWQSDDTLKRNLVTSAITQPACPSGNRFCNACNAGLEGKCLASGVVYELSCKLCARKGLTACYIGETKRPIRLRLNEHILAAKNLTPDTPLGDHFIEKHSTDIISRQCVPVTVKILQSAKDHPERKIAESLQIRKLKPIMNRNVSSWRLL